MTTYRQPGAKDQMTIKGAAIKAGMDELLETYNYQAMDESVARDSYLTHRLSIFRLAAEHLFGINIEPLTNGAKVRVCVEKEKEIEVPMFILPREIPSPRVPMTYKEFQSRLAALPTFISTNLGRSGDAQLEGTMEMLAHNIGQKVERALFHMDSGRGV